MKNEPHDEKAQKDVADTNETSARECRDRMLEWSNPVEFVNNMYGCHPNDDGQQYFKNVFRRGK